MKKKIGLGLCLGLLLVLAGGARLFAAVYTFDSDNQGWKRHGIIKVDPNGTINNSASLSGDYETVSALADAAWYDDGGNGCLRVTAHYFNQPPYSSSKQYRPRPYDTAVVAGFGDLNGKALRADFKRSGNDFSTLAGSEPTIRWFISDTSFVSPGVGTWYVSRVGVSPRLNDLTGSWETLSIDLDPGNFFLWPNGDNSLTFAEVLQQPDNYIGITILSSAADNAAYGYDTSNPYLSTLPDYGASAAGDVSYLYIDNVRVVPVPGAAWLLGSGLLGLLGVCRRRRRLD